VFSLGAPHYFYSFYRSLSTYFIAFDHRKSNTAKKTPWHESASELYRPSDRRLTAKLAPTFADRGCHVVSVTDPYGCILGFLDQNPVIVAEK
jgi:CBS-domain-containing membrane protein